MKTLIIEFSIMRVAKEWKKKKTIASRWKHADWKIQEIFIFHSLYLSWLSFSRTFLGTTTSTDSCHRCESHQKRFHPFTKQVFHLSFIAFVCFRRKCLNYLQELRNRMMKAKKKCSRFRETSLRLFASARKQKVNIFRATLYAETIKTSFSRLRSSW